MTVRPAGMLAAIFGSLLSMAAAWELPLGVYGPITSISQEFLATAVLAALDIDKSWDASVVTTYGAQIANFTPHADLTSVKYQIGTSNSEPAVGIATAIEFFQGSGGRTKILGLVGGYHSAISMPVTTLAAYYKVPQVSWGSTNAKLSIKEVYPYFLRTIPPDSIQGSGMWQVIKHFNIPTVTFMYSQDAYGEGMFQVVTGIASTAGESFRITPVGIKFMAPTYDPEEARAKIQLAKAAMSKVIFLTCTTDQGRGFFPVAAQEGITGTGYQIIGSEALPKLTDAENMPAGYMYLTPMSRGDKFAEFEAMWKKLTLDAVQGSGAVTKYGLNLFKVLLTDGNADALTNAVFTNTDTLPMEAPFIFDAAWSLVIAANNLLEAGTASADIKEEVLLNAVRAVEFEGVSGFVKFDENGDRLASYHIVNLDATKTEVKAALYSSSDGTVSLLAGQSLYWQNQETKNDAIPDGLVACMPGFYKDAQLLCQQCSAGMVTTADGTGCETCATQVGFGFVAVDGPNGRTCQHYPVQIGVYGPITSVSNYFLATAVAFDLDFRKHFDNDVQTRFGPPVIANTWADSLRVKLQIGTSHSDPDIGVGTTLEMFQGKNGRDAIVGLVGGYHSAISMPVASLATQFKVTQVSFGSTSPKLSSKAEYPYFLRTIPPDSIQGAGMWRFIKHFAVPSVTFIYAQESYGEGLFQTISEISSLANEGFRVTGVGIKYMPDAYDSDVADAGVTTVKKGVSKILMVAMTMDQATGFFAAMNRDGLLGTDYQVIGSEALSAGAFVAAGVNFLPVGYIWFTPAARGPLFSDFGDLWKKMTVDDVLGAEAVEAYGLDLFKVNVTEGRSAPITAGMFTDAGLEAFPLEAPYLFDACYTFAFAANKMITTDGIAPADISGDPLLETVQNIQFTGISGNVQFNTKGDRLAQYFISNLQAGSTYVDVGPFDAASDTISIDAGKQLYWMDGEARATVPPTLTECKPGFYKDAQLMCQKCTGSLVTNAAKDGCVACGTGQVAVEDELTGRRCEFYPLKLGYYGPITSIHSEFLAMGVAFDLDFRKNSDASLVTRFGPPVLAVPGLRSELTVKLQIGTSNSNPEVGVATNLDWFDGKNGREAIVGLVGGYHSAISMPVASLATQYKIPQVSWGSTSPKLSNKDTYPYFLRTIPPDSIQGGGMWQTIKVMNIPSVSLVYAQESYGEGLFQTVSDSAAEAKEGFRIQGMGVRYMPNNYDQAVAVAAVNQVMGMSSKVVLVCMTSDQGRGIFEAAKDAGLMGDKYQLMASEALPYSKFTDLLGAGYMWFNPMSQGPLFPKFAEMWTKMKADDVIGASATTSYGLDKFKVTFDDGAADAPTDAMFTSTDTMQLESPYVFDALYTFVFAANTMMNQGVAIQDIKGEELLEAVKAADFEGISGTVKFNAEGDRLASYKIENVQPASGRRLATGPLQVVTAAIYSAATGGVTYEAGVDLYWMSGVVGKTIPAVMTACNPGFDKDEAGICQKCQAGYISLGGADPCTKCPAGTAANLPLGATECIACSVGSVATGEANTECLACEAGTYNDKPGGSECIRCAQGFYQIMTGQTGCDRCQVNMNTLVIGAASSAECKCNEGFYRDSRGNPDAPCMPCKEGMQCPFDSDMKTYYEWHESGRPAEHGAFPLTILSHMTMADDPLSVYFCNVKKKCPGGPPGTCGQNVDAMVRSCSLCKDGFYWNGDMCAECNFVEANSIIFPLLPILLAPIVICVLYRASRDEADKWGTWRNGLAAFGFIILNHYQITTLINNANLQYSSNVMGFLRFFEFTEDPSAIFKPQCSGFKSAVNAMLLKALGPIFVLVLVVVTFIGSWLVKFTTRKAVAFDINRTMNIYFSLMFTFFAGISAMAMSMFKCADNPNGIETLSKDQSIVCSSGEWWGMVVIAIFAVIFYIFGFGGLFTWIVRIAPKKFGDEVFRRRWKFLFIKFRPDVWWWALVICAKGVIMNVGYTFLQTGLSQLFWVMSIILAYSALTIAYMPWRHRLGNIVDLYTNYCLFFVASLLAFYVHGDVSELSDVEGTIGGTLIFINLSPFGVGAFAIARMIWEQQHPGPKIKRNRDIQKLLPSLLLFSGAPEEEIVSFMERIDEWGRHYIFSAMHVVSTEFVGDGSKPRLSDGKLKSTSSYSTDNAAKLAAGIQQTTVYL